MNAGMCRFPAMTLLLAALLAGCAGSAGGSLGKLDFSKYAHQGTDGTVNLYWNCNRPAPGVVRVQGLANNPNYTQPLEDLTFRLYGWTAQGYVSRASASAQDYWLNLNAPSPFTIDLKSQGEMVRFELSYSYIAPVATVGGGDEKQNQVQNACADLAP
jgi:hypothetical protein